MTSDSFLVSFLISRYFFNGFTRGIFASFWVLYKTLCPMNCGCLALLELWPPSSQLRICWVLPLHASALTLVYKLSQECKWDNCWAHYVCSCLPGITVPHWLMSNALKTAVQCILFGVWQFKDKYKYYPCYFILAGNRSVIWFQILLIISSDFQQLQSPQETGWCECVWLHCRDPHSLGWQSFEMGLI